MKILSENQSSRLLPSYLSVTTARDDIAIRKHANDAEKMPLLALRSCEVFEFMLSLICPITIFRLSFAFQFSQHLFSFVRLVSYTVCNYYHVLKNCLCNFAPKASKVEQTLSNKRSYVNYGIFLYEHGLSVLHVEHCT